MHSLPTYIKRIIRELNHILGEHSYVLLHMTTTKSPKILTQYTGKKSGKGRSFFGGGGLNKIGWHCTQQFFMQ